MNVALAGRRIALVGGAGFIGHHLAVRLAEHGAEVHVVDSLAINHAHGASAGELDLAIMCERFRGRSRLPGGTSVLLGPARQAGPTAERFAQLRAARVALVVQDARDRDGLTRVLGRIAPQTIVHLAAVAHANRANRDPSHAFEHSLRTLESALAFARTHYVEHFVFLSSSMVYGNFLADAVDEHYPLNPVGVYGALKLTAEKMVIAHQQVFDLPCTIIRPSALYGPRCVSRRVVQSFIENALAGRPLRVDGDGSDRLDFTCIDDLIDGLLLAIRSPAARNQTFNMTYGQARTIRELAGVVLESFPGVPVEFAQRDQLLPTRGTLSIQRARSVLGYAPEIPIEAGIPRYIQWHRELLMARGRERQYRDQATANSVSGRRSGG